MTESITNYVSVPKGEYFGGSSFGERWKGGKKATMIYYRVVKLENYYSFFQSSRLLHSSTSEEKYGTSSKPELEVKVSHSNTSLTMALKMK